MSETALVVEVPEAQELYDRWVGAWDAPPGVPAHVTILIPFSPAPELDDLRKLFGRFPPFAFSLSEVRRFPDVVYLAPEPAEFFVELTEAVVDRYPDYPPYGGLYEEIVPHLTIVQSDDHQLLARAQTALADMPQLESTAESVALLAHDLDGAWRQVEAFRLGT
jgi:2'-5' RNA ligase